ncbi:unnamed protein product [Rotaria sp. Silwood2]|nr:unnamed protein product [Rotaria sp. Silwood2]CAF2570485.1 unnamed protein product [Rotaria sp. Silwood2]CAF2964132.1 unnamed protein product [Rotaria sp. Silwood2]CAF4380687.1 unnamed protein product [Rotaria sp. Silwood2]
MLFSSSNTNNNNSYIPLEKDNLSAVYAYYQIDPQMYPPPDLQFNKTIQQSFYPSHLYLQPSTFDNTNLLEQQENICHYNNRQRFRNRRKDKKRLKSNRNRTKNNKRSKSINNFHQQNIITVRRISYHDIFNSQTIMKKQFEYEQNNLNNETIINQGNNKTELTNLIENPSQNSKNYPTEYNSSFTLVKVQTSPIQSTINKCLISPSTTNHNTNILTTLVPNILFQQQEHEKKMSRSINMTTVKVNSVSDSSASSLAFTQILADDNNQTKPDVTISGSQIDFGTLSTSHLPTTSSIVSHFSSTIAPHVSHHILSSTTALSKNIDQTKSIITPTLTNENIQNLVDQLKYCINRLSLLLENKIEDKKYVISNRKSYSNDKISTSEKKQIELLSSSSSLISTRTCSRFSRQSISDANDFFFKDIIVQRCNSFNNYQGQKSMF